MRNKIDLSSDKRSDRRAVPLTEVPITIIPSGQEKLGIIKMVDLSENGISFITSTPLAIDSHVSIMLQKDKDKSSLLRNAGRIRRCEMLSPISDDAAQFRCALSLHLSSTQHHQWKKFIAANLSAGEFVVDRRTADRPMNGLVFQSPAKHQAYRFSKHSHFIQIQQLRLKDLGDLERIEIEAWGKEMCASREMLNSRINVFPEGMLGARIDGKLVGYVAMMMINIRQLDKNFTWWDITDQGRIKATHQPNGDGTYGVSLSVVPGAPKNVALLLMKAAGILTIRKGLKGTLFGARIPNYHKHHKTHSLEEYIKATTKSGRMLDPELALYKQANFPPVRGLPNYFPDPESLNNGVLVSCLNPFYEFQRGEGLFFLKKITIDFT